MRAGLVALLALPLLYLGLMAAGVDELTAATLAGGAMAVTVVGLAAWVIGRQLRSLRDGGGASVERTPLLVAPVVDDVGARAEIAFRADDPAFTCERLFAHARVVAERMAVGDFGVLYAFFFDGLFQRLQTQHRLGGLPREFTAFAALPVKALLLSEYAVGTQYQHATVRASLGEGRDTQTLALTFLRRRLAQTRSAGLAETKCPHCGAPLELSATQRCRFCEAVVNSGAHDWVLCGLTPGAQQLGRPGDVIDPENLRQLDPDLAAEELVDRATLTFWRWLEARRSGHEGRLVRVVSPQFLETLEANPPPEGAVTSGGGELRALRSFSRFDEAHVLMRWADSPAAGTRSHQTVFKLRRPHGLRTPVGAGLSTFRCPKCLAAVTDAETPICDYCGASLQDAWCLDALEPFAVWSDQAVAMRKKVGGDWARVATPAQREAALGLLVSVAKADGVVSDAERERLEAIATRWQLPAGQVAAALEAAVQMTPKFARELALTLTQELAELAFLGGKLEPKERKRLDAIAAVLGTEAELSRALARLVTSALSPPLPAPAGRGPG